MRSKAWDAKCPRYLPMVKPGKEPEKNDTTGKKAEAVLSPRDAIHTIAQVAVANSEVFRCQRPDFTQQYATQADDGRDDQGRRRTHNPALTGRKAAPHSPSHAT